MVLQERLQQNLPFSGNSGYVRSESAETGKIRLHIHSGRGSYTGHRRCGCIFVSIIAIKFLMGYIKKHDFKAFGWYRIVLGVLVLGYFVGKNFLG